MNKVILLFVFLGTLTACIKEKPSKPKQYIPSIAETYSGDWIITDTITNTDPQKLTVQYNTDSGRIRENNDTSVRLFDFFALLCTPLNAHTTYNVLTPVRDSLCDGNHFPIVFSARRNLEGDRNRYDLFFSYTVVDTASAYPVQVRGRATRYQ